MPLLLTLDPVFSWLLRWGNVLGAFASVGVSLLLAYLYFQQHQLLKIERSPSIELSDYEVDGDELNLYISNYGDGLAKNLRVKTMLEFPEGGNGVQIAESRLNRIEGGERLFERAIGSDERGIRFRGEPKFPILDVTCADFSTGVLEMKGRDLSEVKFQLYLRCDTELGETRQEEVFWPKRWVEFNDERLEAEDRLDLEVLHSMSGLIPRKATEESAWKNFD